MDDFKNIEYEEIDRVAYRIKMGFDNENDLVAILNFRNKNRKIFDSINKIFEEILEEDDDFIVSKRLKRLSSIYKEIIHNNVILSDMDDILGIRIIFNTLEEVINFSIALKYRKNINNFILLEEKDYIENKKENGYRAIHQIFQCNKKNSSNHKIKLELQIRTRLQNMWSNLLEFFKFLDINSTKNGVLKPHYIDFLKCLSILIEQKEMNCYTKEHIKYIVLEMEKIDKKYFITKKLNDLKVINEEIKEKTGGIILIFNSKEKTISHICLKDTYALLEIYKTLEIYYKVFKSKYINIVYLEMEKLEKVKEIYSNYFFDMTEFKKFMEDIKKINFENIC